MINLHILIEFQAILILFKLLKKILDLKTIFSEIK